MFGKKPPGGYEMKTIAMVLAVLCVMYSVHAEEIPDMTAVSVGINEFTFDLYQKLNTGDGNVFCSPFSVSTALAMTYAGAQGETETQMAEVLKFGLNQDLLHPAYADLFSRIEKSCGGEDCEFNLANRLWAQKGFTFLASYLKLVRAYYDASVGMVDFVKQLESARMEINTWVEEQTRDKIKDLIKPGMLDPRTRLVLVNAIYFKGSWAVEFEKEATKDARFRTLAGKKVNVPMMYREDEYRFLKEAKFKLLELPYRGNELSMIVLLPRDPQEFRDVETSLTSEEVNRWLNEARQQKVQVWLPRFKVTSEFDLSRMLGVMGMPLAFSGQADFSGMTGAKGLAIGSVIHKAFVDVNEEGTEAAAATAVMMRLTAMPSMEPPAEFKADHPFIFIIRDNNTETILFIGRVADPTISE